MNILLINHYAGSPELGMEFRPFFLAREWLEMGHKVRVVGASFSHLRRVQPDCTGDGAVVRQSGIEFQWLRTPPYRGNGFGRVRNMLTFLVRLWNQAPRLAQEFGPDVVIASSTYPADIFPAKRVASRRKAVLVFEVHDLWPLSPQILGNMSRWHPFIAAMQVAENKAYRWADRVVSMLPLAKGHMVSHGMAAGKFVHIPNGVATREWLSTDEPLPEEHRRVLEELRRGERFIVCYAGAHGLANALESFVDAAPLLEGTRAHLLLVGGGPEKPALEARARAQAVDRVTFLPPGKHAAVPALLSAIDALYLGWRRCPLYRYGISPNKLFEYMMAAKPIIHSIEAGNDPVAEARCGLSVEPENPAAVAGAVRELLAMPQSERRAMGARGRTYVLENHDYAVLARRFLRAVEECRPRGSEERSSNHPA